LQQFTQKYAIIQLFENMPEGTEFHWKNWPLHTTIADVFAIDWSVPIMKEKLTELLSTHAQATSVAEEGRAFGDDGQVQVVLLKKLTLL